MLYLGRLAQYTADKSLRAVNLHASGSLLLLILLATTTRTTLCKRMQLWRRPRSRCIAFVTM